MQLARIASISILLAIPALAGDHHVVALDGSGEFTTIQAAVDAAADGDVIHVRLPGDPDAWMAGADLGAKSVTLYGTGTQPVNVGPFEIDGLPAHGLVTLRGFDFNRWDTYSTSTHDAGRPGLSITSSAGAVRLRDCRFNGPVQGANLPALALTAATDVSLESCTVVGGQLGLSGLPAIVARASAVAIYGSEVRGGSRGVSTAYQDFIDTPPGGPGLDLGQRSVSWLGASTVVGGAGAGFVCHSGCSVLHGGDGGPGAVVSADSILYRLDTLLEGGAGGIAEWAWTSNVPGDPGPPLVGIETAIPGAQRELSAAEIAPNGVPFSVTLRGEPGEDVTVFVATSGHHRHLGPLYGVFLLEGLLPAHTLDAGPMPASGERTVELDLPDVAAGDAQALSVQALFRSGPNRFRLSNVASVVRQGEGVHQPTCGGRVYVDAGAAPGGDGSSWSRAFDDLHDALLIVPACESGAVEVWIAGGTYRPAPPGGQQTRTWRLRAGVALRGGFAGTETSPGQRVFGANETVLDGDLNGDDVAGWGNRGDNARSLFNNMTEPLVGLVFERVTLRGSENGPAAWIRGSAAFRDCLFTENRNLGIGSGVWQTAGGLQYETWPNMTSGLELVGCRFVRNEGYLAGGAHLRTQWTSVRIHGCLFQENHKTTYTAAQRGIAFGVDSVGNQWDVEVINCTFLDNRLTGNACYQSTIHLPNPATATVVNNLFWGTTCNGAPLTTALWQFPASAGYVLDYNGFQALPAGWPAGNNSVADPLFAAPGDPRLGPGSPFIDAGDSFAVPPDLTLDLDGRPRLADDPGAPNTGQGHTRFVDRGAYER